MIIPTTLLTCKWSRAARLVLGCSRRHCSVVPTRQGSCGRCWAWTALATVHAGTQTPAARASVLVLHSRKWLPSDYTELRHSCDAAAVVFAAAAALRPVACTGGSGRTTAVVLHLYGDAAASALRLWEPEPPVTLTSCVNAASYCVTNRRLYAVIMQT